MKESELRKVAQARIRRLIRERKEGEEVWSVLQYEVPDEKIVPKWDLAQYRKILRDEWNSYIEGEKKKKCKERKEPERRTAIQPTKKQIPNSSKKSRFRR